MADRDVREEPMPAQSPKAVMGLHIPTRSPAKGRLITKNNRKLPMKIAIRPLGAAALLGAAVSLSPLALPAFGQEAVTQTTTTSAAGTITEFTPGGDSVVLHSETSSEPIRYSYSKTTTVVDENGQPVDVSVIKTGVPVHVFYDRDGDQMVARRIVVQRTTAAPVVVAPAPAVIQKDTTTTTTTEQH